ncbi:hypothetical protein M0802_016693 [Mischocyttarus mexicanus]|nr:hypothetical protein M0802_016693 [Mischocyttarus mexicanus]
MLNAEVWAQNDFRDETNGGLARLDSTGHGAHTPGGSNPGTPGVTSTMTQSGGFSTAQPRSRTNTTHRPNIQKGLSFGFNSEMIQLFFFYSFPPILPLSSHDPHGFIEGDRNTEYFC